MTEKPKPFREGPFTDRQIQILDALIAGLRHRSIARELEVSESTTRNEMTNCGIKMGLDTSAQVFAVYSRAKTFQEAADLVRKDLVWSPKTRTDEHINHVLGGLADLFEKHAAALMPK